MVLFVGSYGTGITVRVPRVPEAGETLSGSQLAIGFGGKSSNQAVAAARNGAQAEIITAIGTDAFAQDAKAMWEREGVSHDLVKIDSNAATMAGVILVEPSGENRIAIAPGALDNLTPQDLDERIDAFNRTDLVVVCLEMPQATVEHAIRLAFAAGARVVLNTAPAGPVDPELLAQVDYVIPNETEHNYLLSLGWEPAAEQHLIVTRGAQGSEIRTGSEHLHVEPYPQDNVVDTTGAGDTFVGVFAAALAAGLNTHQAVQRATVASSLAVTKAEVIPAIPHAQEVNEHLSQYLKGA